MPRERHTLTRRLTVEYTCGGRPEGEPCTWRHLVKRKSCVMAKWHKSGVDVTSARGNSELIRLT